MKRESQYTLIVAGMILVAFIVAIVMTVARLRESRSQHAVPILMYHKIGNVANNAWWVPLPVFERQMRALRNQGYTPILPDDIADHRKAGKKLPPKPVVITFDDGYRDSLLSAEPILKKYGFRAVAFLITENIADTPDKPRQYEGLDCLTWPEVKAMQKRKTFVFGGHGHRHENMAVAADPNPNIRECFRQLRRHGIRRPISFCYPHGEYNERTMEAVRRSGFQCAMVCEDRIALTGKAMNLLALPRVSVMGGEHEFHVNHVSESATPGAIVLRVMHTGIPIEVSPRLVWSGATGDQGWLPPAEVQSSVYEWRWPCPPSLRSDVAGTTSNTLRLEIWDKHRLFLLWSGKI